MSRPVCPDFPLCGESCQKCAARDAEFVVTLVPDLPAGWSVEIGPPDREDFRDLRVFGPGGVCYADCLRPTRAIRSAVVDVVAAVCSSSYSLPSWAASDLRDPDGSHAVVRGPDAENVCRDRSAHVEDGVERDCDGSCLGGRPSDAAVLLVWETASPSEPHPDGGWYRELDQLWHTWTVGEAESFTEVGGAVCFGGPLSDVPAFVACLTYQTGLS